MENDKPVQETPKVEPEVTAPKLPERDFFSGGKMLKFAEQAGLLDEKPAEKAAAVVAPKTEVPAPKKPCTNCPPEETKVETTAKAEVKAETRTPIATLKIAGKDRPFYTQEQLNDYFEKLQSMPQRTSEPQKALPKITELMKKAEPAAKGEEPTEADLEMADPGIKKHIDAQKAKIDRLEQVVQTLQQGEEDRKRDRLANDLDAEVTKIRTTLPFDEVEDEELGRITDRVFGSVFASFAKEDIDEGKPIKSTEEYIQKTAKVMNVLQTKIRGGNGKSAEKLTTDTFKASYPEMYEEIRQAGIADYLREQADNPPSVKTQSSEAKVRPTAGKDKGGDGKGISERLKEFNALPESDAFVEHFARLSTHK